MESGLALSVAERDRLLVFQRRLRRRYYQLALISSSSSSSSQPTSSSSRRTGSRCSTSSTESSESSGLGESLSSASSPSSDESGQSALSRSHACNVEMLMTLTLTLVHPASNCTHWATLRRHPCPSTAATSASSQVNPIFCKTLLTVLLQFALGRDGRLSEN